MEEKQVLELYQLFESDHIEVWLLGGWAVDALLGKVTRKHADLDIVIQEKDLPKMRELLEARGYKVIDRDETTPWNFVLGDDNDHEIDVHAVVIDDKGNGIYGPKERDVMFPVASLTGIGDIDGHSVKCISADYMVKFISPWLFKLRDKDFKDVKALCEQFGIDLPKEYKLFGLVREIHLGCFKLCKLALGKYLPVAGNVGVFCQSEVEYEEFLEISKQITEPSSNPKQKYFKLKHRMVMVASEELPEAVYEYLYIRKPSPDSPQLGDIDFILDTEEFRELKQKLEGGTSVPGAKIYERTGWDMIELSNPRINTLAYLSDKVMAEKVRVRFD